MYCTKCGLQNEDNVEFCIHCGAKMTQNTPIATSTNQTTSSTSTEQSSQPSVNLTKSVSESEQTQANQSQVQLSYQDQNQGTNGSQGQNGVQNPNRNGYQGQNGYQNPNGNGYQGQYGYQSQNTYQNNQFQNQYGQGMPLNQMPYQGQYNYQGQNAFYPSNIQNDPPISVAGYIGYFFLFAIPVVGFIMELIYAFGNNVNKNLKNFARAFLIMALIAFVLGLIIVIAFVPYLADLFDSARYHWYYRW